MAVVRATLFVILLLTGVLGSSAFGLPTGPAPVGEVDAVVHCSATATCSSHSDGCDGAICASSAHCAICAAVLPQTGEPVRMESHALRNPLDLVRLADGRTVAPANKPPRRI